VAGVVGAPVSYSLSPKIHNAWIAAAGLDAVYVAFPVAVGRFAAFVEGLRGGAIVGVNVTAPFKAEALTLADQASESARRSGSANLLLFDLDGQVAADSTDGAGMLAAIAAQAPGSHLAGGPTIVLGAGGAARAAGAAVLQAGAPSVRLLARAPDAAKRTAAALDGRVAGADLAKAEAWMADAALLVNATPAGAIGGDFAARMVHRLPSTAVVIDMVYRPLATPLLRAAARRGLGAVDGLAMLIAQARPSFAALFGRAPPALDVRGLALAAMAETDRA